MQAPGFPTDGCDLCGLSCRRLLVRTITAALFILPMHATATLCADAVVCALCNALSLHSSLSSDPIRRQRRREISLRNVQLRMPCAGIHAVRVTGIHYVVVDYLSLLIVPVIFLVPCTVVVNVVAIDGDQLLRLAGE